MRNKADYTIIASNGRAKRILEEADSTTGRDFSKSARPAKALNGFSYIDLDKAVAAFNAAEAQDTNTAGVHYDRS